MTHEKLKQPPRESMQTITFTCDKCKTSVTIDCRKDGEQCDKCGCWIISIGRMEKYDLCQECVKKVNDFINIP